MRRDELAALTDAEATERAAVRNLEAEAQAARAKVGHLRAEWVAGEDGDTKRAAAARKRHDQANRDLERLVVRVEAAQLRARRAADEAAAYHAAHADELIAELAPAAHKVQQDLADLAAGAQALHTRWHEVANEQIGHLKAKGLQPRGNMPSDHGAEAMVREAKRVREVVAPVPTLALQRVELEQEQAAQKAKADRDAQRDRAQRQADALGVNL
jgi:hypothetical protein